jgi:hypothetical protein
MRTEYPDLKTQNIEFSCAAAPTKTRGWPKRRISSETAKRSGVNCNDLLGIFSYPAVPLPSALALSILILNVKMMKESVQNWGHYHSCCSKEYHTGIQRIL